MATVLIGFAGLGSEIPFLIYKHRQMQNAADAAALGGAVALAKGYPSPIATEADGIAAALGFVNGAGGVTVTINNPPKSGAYTSNSSAVEAIVSQPLSLKMVGLFYSSAFNLSARAVALAGSGGGAYCVLATDTGSDQALVLSGGSTVTLNSCGLADNATGSQALDVSGGATLVAQSASVSGQLNASGGSYITVTNGVQVNQPAVADPYANVALPASSGCDYTNFSLNGSGTQQMSPGRYCNNVSVQGTVSMAAGIYYIKSGTFQIQGVLTGSGVTIVLTQNTNGYANVHVSGGNTQVTLSAPTSGSTAGLIFFADRNAPNNGQDQFSGTLSFTGALYFPTQQVQFPGGTSATGCMQLIGWQIAFSGGSAFNSNCANGAGGGGASLLVE